MIPFPFTRCRTFLIPLLAGCILTLPPTRAAQAGTPVNRFENDIVAFETADREAPPPKGAILFVGDSQFRRWDSIHEDLFVADKVHHSAAGYEVRMRITLPIMGAPDQGPIEGLP